MFSAHLTILRLITTLWAKFSKISYLREFSAQVSQLVFWAPLTVLRLITTVWAKISRISYLSDVCAKSITNRVITSFDRYTAYFNHMSYNFKKLISPQDQCRSITNRVLAHLTVFWLNTLNELELRKSHISVRSVHKYHKADLNVLRIIANVWARTSKIFYFADFSSQVSQILFSTRLTILPLIKTVWGKN